MARRRSPAGPDGALWFTDTGYFTGGHSIGRITTTGDVTHYTDPSIRYPGQIAAGPDGALWFTNFGNNSIGRITTTGVITQLPRPRHGYAIRDRGRAGRGTVVHQ